MSTPTNNVCGNIQNDAAAPPPPLPEGWVEKLDAMSSVSFYTNVATGETTWTRPVAAVNNEEDKINGTVTTANSSKDAEKDSNAMSKSAASKRIPNGWKEMKDAFSGESYYVFLATGETTWTRPVVAANEDDKISDGNKSNEAKSKSTAAPNKLPNGWKEMKDTFSGESYYVNSENDIRRASDQEITR